MFGTMFTKQRKNLLEKKNFEEHQDEYFLFSV